jgi:hypothetical protein
MKALSSKILLASVVLAGLLSVGCGKTPGADDSAAGTDQNATASPRNQLASGAGSENSAPFSNRERSEETAGSQERNDTKPAEAVAKQTIPAGTPITVRLQSAVSSATSNSGDRFDAVLAEPLQVNGKTVTPSGAAVTGRVVAANPSGRLQHPGMIELALSSIEIEGKSVAISTTTISAKGASHKKRNWAMIGGGAGGGALLGGLLGGGKGALIGSTVGAGAGTATAFGTGKKDVGFGAERHLTFRLKQSVQVR